MKHVAAGSPLDAVDCSQFKIQKLIKLIPTTTNMDTYMRTCVAEEFDVCMYCM